MYVGHFAIGLAIKAWRPQVPAAPIIIGVGLLDILYGLFVVAGIDRIAANLQSGPYLFFDLTFIDWDHSLLMAAAVSLCWGAFFSKNKQVAMVAVLAVFSHFMADWLVHNNDLALYPHSAAHVGLGLWGMLGTASWALEGAFSALLAIWVWRANARRGVGSGWSCLLLAILFFQLSPWFSPMLLVATLGEPAVHLAHGALILVGFVLPALLFIWLIQRAEQNAGRTRPLTQESEHCE